MTFYTPNANTVQCKRNANEIRVFRSLFSRKFDEILPRNFVKALANFRWVKRNFASTDAKFRFAKFRRSENSQLRNFAIAKIRLTKFRQGKNSKLRNFHKAKFCWQWRRVVVKTFCSDRFTLRWLDWIFWGWYLPTLGINYVCMSKDMEKRLPQLYYIKMKISYDLGFIAIGVAMAT